MDPWKNWAIVGIVGVGAAYYYSQSSKSKRGRGRASPLVSPEQNQRRGSDHRNGSKDKRKKKKSKVSDTSDQQGSDVADVSSASVQTSTNGTVKKRKGGKKQPSKLAQSSAVDVSPEKSVGTENDDVENEGMDNEEFARQLSGVKTGTSLKKVVTQNETKKTKKQGKPNEAPQPMNGSTSKTNGITSSQDMSTASSTTGADADDDLSPAMSPDLRATQATTPSSNDVSDMLEPASKGPSILRITDPVNSPPIKQPKAQKATLEPETKKQRQNRRKNEQKKAAREQAEKERRALLENQLRTAREAEGKPAKNGLGPAQLPTNAWNKPANAATNSTGPATEQSSVSLLDTLEDTPTISLNPHSTNGGPNGSSVDKKVWNNDLPSEEEQMRMITEMDSDNAWSTVAKGGKSKKKLSAATPANKETINSSGNQKKGPSSATFTAESLAANKKKNFQGNNDIINNHTPSTMPTTSANHDSTTSSGSVNQDLTNGGTAAKGEDPNETANSHTDDNDNNSKPAPDKKSEAQEPKHVKATYETIDHSVWTRENITEHPDYDPDFPYALTGHPDDDEWAVC